LRVSGHPSPYPRQRWGVVAIVLLLLLSGAMLAYLYRARGGGADGDISFSRVDGPVAGTSGPLLRYRIGVQNGLGVPLDEFAATVESILSDPRSWTGGATLRLQRVSGAGGPVDAQQRSAWDFTIYLVSPQRSEEMCLTDGLQTQQYTSCRLSDGRVVINSDRWLTAIPDYGAPLAEYRAYAINHEVGHQLGHQHELCPGPGSPAPVMQQQTYGLKGCTAYGWPYRDGELYTGPSA
jgi:hypothetical protein